MFKKIMTVLLLLAMLLSSTTSIFAESEPTFSLSEYNQLKNAGYIGDDVSFEDMKQWYDDAKQLENFGVGRNVVDIQSQTTTGVRLPYDLPQILSSGDYTMKLQWTWK